MIRTTFILFALLASISFTCVAQATFEQHSVPRPLTSKGLNVLKITEHGDLPASCIYLDWSTFQSVWDSTARNTFIYNPNGQTAELYVEDYSGNQFVPYQRFVYSYDPQLHRKVTDDYRWNGSILELRFRQIDETDPFGNPTLTLSLVLNQAQWDTSTGTRTSNSYVFNDKISTITKERWSSFTHQWTNSDFEQYTWPDSSGWDSHTFSTWNGTGWSPIERFIDLSWYDFEKGLPNYYRDQRVVGIMWQDNYITERTYGQFDGYTSITHTWDGSSWDSTKSIIGNDAMYHPISFAQFEWASGWQQVGGGTTDYIYDSQGNTAEWTSKYWSPGGQYINNERKQCFSFFTGIEDLQSNASAVTAYPNPCSDHLNFKLNLNQNGPAHIALYDLQGRLRLQTITPVRVGEDIAMPISETLEDGTYIYRIQTKAGEATGKVAVQR